MAEYIYSSKGFSMPGWGGWSPMKHLGSENLSIDLSTRMDIMEKLGLSPLKSTVAKTQQEQQQLFLGACWVGGWLKEQAT